LKSAGRKGSGRIKAKKHAQTDPARIDAASGGQNLSAYNRVFWMRTPPAQTWASWSPKQSVTVRRIFGVKGGHLPRYLGSQKR
jgi:hypothetical protein